MEKFGIGKGCAGGEVGDRPFPREGFEAVLVGEGLRSCWGREDGVVDGSKEDVSVRRGISQSDEAASDSSECSPPVSASSVSS